MSLLKTSLLTTALLAASHSLAAGLEIELELPALAAADYRRPYVAIWLERPDHSVAANLAVWYDIKMRNAEGAKWLKDMRLWWRRSGRDLEPPIDGVTSATRRPGVHKLAFVAGEAPLGTLAAGEYVLFIEAAREHGGREVLSQPLQWPPQGNTLHQLQGQHELGRVGITLKP